MLGKDEETKHLREALTSNDYPKVVIHCHSMQSNSRMVDRCDTQAPVVILPYVQGVLEAVRRILTPLRHLLMRPKDRIAEGKLTGVVYQVPCVGCPATYVGQTNRRLNQWLSEHRRAVKSGEAATSALAKYAWGAQHPVDWDKVRVLDHQPHHHRD